MQMQKINNTNEKLEELTFSHLAGISPFLVSVML